MATDATRYREDFDQNGLSPAHKEVISRVPSGSRVLEVGCSSGYIGKILSSEKECVVAGIEVDPSAAKEARNNGLRVFEGSLEDPDFRASIKERFDVVLATDVLEHLKDPAPVLNHFKQWLDPRGQAIIAVPNIATWQIRKQLLLYGDFEYQESGILDRTHLHFFTWNTLHKLVKEQGWSIVETMAEWHLPFGRALLLETPKDVRGYVTKLAEWGPPGRLASALASPWAVRIEKAGQDLTERIFNRWPNACASHVTLVLSNPDAPLTSAASSRRAQA